MPGETKSAGGLTRAQVVVIGGGLAGLSAAAALADVGVRVQLLEKRPYLGGRATSYALPDGSHVDNCQHVNLGCGTNLPDFYRRCGAEKKIRYYRRLYLADKTGRVNSIESSALPPPFHMSLSMLRFRGMSFEDKRAIGRGMMAIARAGGKPEGYGQGTMLEWLKHAGQSEAAIAKFWQPPLISALSEELDRTDSRYGIDVFWKAFLANRSGYVLAVPAVPLAELYSGCRKVIEDKGGEVRTRATVRSLRFAEGKFQAAVLDDGSEIAAAACISAVPYDALAALLPPDLSEKDGCFTNLKQLQPAPITGVHFWFDRVIFGPPFLCLLEHTVQWIFNKSRLYAKDGNSAPDAGQYLQLVISASHGLIPRSRQEIIDLCLRELGEVLPAVREAKLLKATVVKEVSAVFSPRPGCDEFRPPQETKIPGLFLAGDWTLTGWPSTMEGAVRSGYLAAEAALKSCGHAQNFIIPDLPVQGFCRRWSAARASASAV